jgi:hypothetical protein
VALSKIDPQVLQSFEAGFNPRHPSKSTIPAKILGYGEISTVLEVSAQALQGLACKRMPMFQNTEEVENYFEVYKRYLKILEEDIGLNLLPSETTWISDAQNERVIGYIFQEKVSPDSVGHHTLHRLPDASIVALVQAVLRETGKVFKYNQEHRGKIEVGFDGQISNWAIADFDPEKPVSEDEIKLFYFDTSTPLTQIDGAEQLDPELFLRSAPSFLVWILRLLFLEDILTRYYDFRKVAVDLIANFIKEGRPDLVPELVEEVNAFFVAEFPDPDRQPITTKEVQSYYREDAMIWRLYLGFRKVDRTLHRMVGADYPYVLPEKVRR